MILRLETADYIMEVYMKKWNETERILCYNLIEKKNESLIHHQSIRSALIDEKMKNPSEEELEKRKELYQIYHFDEVEFLELELNKQHITYQKFLSNQF